MIHFYVLNLDERKDRWENMQKQLSELKDVKVVRIGATRHPISANTGIRDSHLQALDAIQKQPRSSFGIVLEDDVVLQSNFMEVVNNLLKKRNWEVMLLGATTVIPQRGNHMGQISIPVRRFVGCWAYIVSPKSAAKLSDGLRLQHNHEFVDFDMADCCDGQGGTSIIARVCVPFIAGCQADYSDNRGGYVDDSVAINITNDELVKLIS